MPPSQCLASLSAPPHTPDCFSQAWGSSVSRSGSSPSVSPSQSSSCPLQTSGAATGVSRFWHPASVSQESTVQGSPSSQSGAGPPVQALPWHWSAVVQASLSSQGSVLSTYSQPMAGLHPSLVQSLASLHTGASPPVQVPPWHWSFKVQALPSSQPRSLFVCWQAPVVSSQPSSVQTFPSPQFFAAPGSQMPDWH